MTTPAAAAARNDAIIRLIREHRADFDRIYREEAAKRGVQPRNLRRNRERSAA